MYSIHPLAVSFLIWLVATNRCHLKKLEKSEQISEMNTPYQYLMLSGTPTKEKKFQDLKKKLGTYLGFHGSNANNWHCIFRKGLMNMSGTKNQLNGQAYGSGIYLANDAQTSFGYMKYQNTWKKSIFSEEKNQLGVMALCEIIKDTSVKTTPYYVVPNNDFVTTRYFFIYMGGGNSTAKGTALKLPEVKW